MATFRLDLPPTTNHGYGLAVRGAHAAMYKTRDLRAWEREAALVVGGWRPPARTALSVRIQLRLPPGSVHRVDVDGCLKPILDVTVGRRQDQWIERLSVLKVTVREEPAGVLIEVESLRQPALIEE